MTAMCMDLGFSNKYYCILLRVKLNLHGKDASCLLLDMTVSMLCSRVRYHLSGGSYLLYCSFTKLRTTHAHIVSDFMKHLALHTKRFLCFFLFF